MPRSKAILQPSNSEGHRLLTLYLHNTNRAMFGDAIGCTRQYVSLLEHGQCAPGLAFAFAIERVTCGRVPAKAWTLRAGAT